jgi:hypothetical protein
MSMALPSISCGRATMMGLRAHAAVTRA